MYHDDWGTERDSFFGEKMMDEIVYEPNEIFFRHVKESGVAMVFHTCGCVMRFLPQMVALGPNFLQLQARCNDLQAIKEQYGDKLGLDVPMFGMTSEDIIKYMRSSVDNFAKDGGMFSTVFGGDEKILWDGMQELYWYSREYHEK